MSRNLATLLQTAFDFDVFIAAPVVATPPTILPPVIGDCPAPALPPGNDNEAPLGAEALLQVLKQKLVIFASGMSRIGDLDAGTFAWNNLRSRGIGVEAGELSSTAVEAIAEAVVIGKTQIFVDSGAFSEFKRSLRNPSQLKGIVHDLFADETEKLLASCQTIDFQRVWLRYEAIKATIAYYLNGDSGIEGSATPDDPDYPRPLFVMPDVVGDQAASLALVERYRAWILEEIEQNQSRPIIPIQVGALTLTQAFDRIIEVLDGRSFIAGIPSNEKSVTPDELREFIRETRPSRLHFLGAASSKTLDPKLEIIASVGHEPEHLSADANICRSQVYGKGIDKSRFRAIVETLYRRSAEAQQATGEIPGWRKIKPGDRLPDGTHLVLKGLKCSLQATDVASQHPGGRVIPDGPLRFAVTAS
ncbi:hypothetical protein IC232_03215 [Microvirga sp. BT688]|uniref:hypothetical protein n=1 Tax=Microvirga sp. TaxID=1873136 RepID=UPI001685A894|nr:hypothetical protein [Microvirga sp.]MBD2745698.1 hypothetical protein [Microvirga sp.]